VRDVTNRRVDDIDSVHGVNVVPDEDFDHQRFMSAPSADTRQRDSRPFSDIQLGRLLAGDDVLWVSQVLDVDVWQSLMCCSVELRDKW